MWLVLLSDARCAAQPPHSLLLHLPPCRAVGSHLAEIRRAW